MGLVRVFRRFFEDSYQKAVILLFILGCAVSFIRILLFKGCTKLASALPWILKFIGDFPFNVIIHFISFALDVRIFLLQSRTCDDWIVFNLKVFTRAYGFLGVLPRIFLDENRWEESLD